jgi:hypothetical protein
MLQIHHVSLATRDFASTALWLEDIGLASVQGYKLPHVGWSNLVVPVSHDTHQYIEVLGVTDREQAARHPYGGAIDALTARGDRLVAWALLADDVDAIGTRLGLKPELWSAVSPAGESVQWKLVGNIQAWTEPFLPFFREDPPEFHRSVDAKLAEASHSIHPTGFSSVEIEGDEKRLREWLGGEDAPAHITEGTPALRSVTISTAEGDEIVISPVGSRR